MPTYVQIGDMSAFPDPGTTYIAISITHNSSLELSLLPNQPIHVDRFRRPHSIEELKIL